MVKNFVLNSKGFNEDAEDIFQEGLFIFLKMAKQNKLPETLKPEAYLFTICKNLWLKHLKKDINTSELSDQVAAISLIGDSPLDELLNKERKKIVSQILAQLGEKCRQLLHDYYYEKKKMKTIANQRGYGSEQVVKNKKVNCMKKLREIVFSSAKQKKWFRE